MLDGPWIRYVYDQDDFRPPDQDFIALRQEFVNNSLDETELRAVGYAENTWRFGEQWTFTPGLRYDYDGFSGNSDWSPRLAAGFELNPKTKFHTALGLYYQYPRFLAPSWRLNNPKPEYAMKGDAMNIAPQLSESFTYDSTTDT